MWSGRKHTRSKNNVEHHFQWIHNRSASCAKRTADIYAQINNTATNSPFYRNALISNALSSLATNPELHWTLSRHLLLDRTMLPPRDQSQFVAIHEYDAKAATIALSLHYFRPIQVPKLVFTSCVCIQSLILGMSRFTHLWHWEFCFFPKQLSVCVIIIFRFFITRLYAHLIIIVITVAAS